MKFNPYQNMCKKPQSLQKNTMLPTGFKDSTATMNRNFSAILEAGKIIG